MLSNVSTEEMSPSQILAQNGKRKRALLDAPDGDEAGGFSNSTRSENSSSKVQTDQLRGV